jgi:hypothetical protein
MVQDIGRSMGVKGRLLVGWWRESFGLIVLLGLLIGVTVAQAKSPEQGMLLNRRDGRG